MPDNNNEAGPDVPGKETEPRPVPPPHAEPAPRHLPFSKWHPIAWGAAIGMFYRVTFSGWPSGIVVDAMSAAFLFGTPLVIGAFTVLVAERTERRSWAYYIFAPWLSVSLCAAGTAVALL